MTQGGNENTDAYLAVKLLPFYRCENNIVFTLKNSYLLGVLF